MGNIFKTLLLLVSLSCSEIIPDQFGLTDVYTKLVNNDGKGYESLGGTRNFRVVLRNAMYRGGKVNPDGNQNPLTLEGLTNLCNAGFSTAIYLYSINFSSAPKIVHCKDRTLVYKQITFNKTKELLSLIYSDIKNNTLSYFNCHNGWHASGRISALALKQFCGWSGKDAVKYWIKNTDGTDNGDYESHKTFIRDFVPYSDLMITEKEKQKMCF